MNSLNKLTDFFRQFPGIGPRQAKRFVFFLLSKDKSFLNELSNLIKSLRDDVEECSVCYRYFSKRKAEKMCSICQDPNRKKDELMIIAKDTDLDSIEKSGSFDGMYFVLGGTLPLLESKPAGYVRVKECVARIKKDSDKAGLKEVILALSANPDGEHTGDVIQNEIAPIAKEKGFRISHLGRGLSTGSELEYADSETIKSALKNRS